MLVGHCCIVNSKSRLFMILNGLSSISPNPRSNKQPLKSLHFTKGDYTMSWRPTSCDHKSQKTLGIYNFVWLFVWSGVRTLWTSCLGGSCRNPSSVYTLQKVTTLWVEDHPVVIINRKRPLEFTAWDAAVTIQHPSISNELKFYLLTCSSVRKLDKKVAKVSAKKSQSQMNFSVK